MSMTFRRYEEIKKISEAMKKDPDNLPQKPRLYEFLCISNNMDVYISTYLYEDYEKSSQKFKDALSNYEKTVKSFDLSAYRAATEGSGGSTTMMLGVGAPMFVAVPMSGSSGGSMISLVKLYKAEKKLMKMEKREGIKRLDSSDYAKIDREYEKKLQQYVEKNTSKELEK